ncbi:D-mannonate dehydratase [Granulicatella balaenopterae]|uniref:Mannonate dehydratase n=1 Tax=Granulicatella balaenopterae TaxID=137733 RepID=A0A1H9P681_9LACT|nr:mannonate dehydratase [Granulicatella balaenopterae]SER43083.1 D-mannonate dehydratase [Granulicatella balaenopterae]
MKWAFRWYGSEGDSIPLQYLKQIPGLNGIVGTLLNKLPGDVWSVEEIRKLKTDVESCGLELVGIESVAIHDAIKAGTKERNRYIDNYIQTIRNLAKCDIRLVCYSFKPIFGWAKTELFYKNDDKSYSLVFDQAVVENMPASEMFQLISSQSKGFRLPGWEEERLKKFNDLMRLYDDITEEDLFNNLKYFLEKVIPVCEEVDVRLGIHPDDPPWEIFGLPRITKNLNDLKRIIEIVDSPYNGITFCTGALGANPDNNLVQMIYELGHRINFVHFRNVGYMGHQKFKETAHETSCGSLDMYQLMKALVDCGFDGVIRPDHGRSIWGESAMPGYGLYDRALGSVYAQGLYEAILKERQESKESM